MNKNNQIVIAILLLLFSVLLFSDFTFSETNIYFKKSYDILLPVRDDYIEIGSLYRHEVDIDENYITQSHYRSKLSIKFDCEKIYAYALENFIHRHLNSSCNSLDREDESNFIEYTSDSYSDGIRYSNAFIYKAIGLNTFDSIIRDNFDGLEILGTYPPEKGKGWFLYWPVPKQYITVFMSKHHEMRLSALVNGMSVEPGIPCDHAAASPFNISHDPFNVCISYDEIKRCNKPNAGQTKYSCLAPEALYFPPDFDDAVESLEPLFLANSKSFSLNAKLYLKHYATILPFYQFIAGKSYPPTGFAYHKKISAESELCYTEESSKDTPKYSSSYTKIRYCRSLSDNTWEKIFLFENDEPILIFFGVDQSKENYN